MARALLEYGADPAAVDDDNKSPLYIAASRGQLGVVQTVVQAMKASGAAGWGGPVTAAAAGGYDDIINELVKIGNFDPNSLDENGVAPISAAAKAGRRDSVKLLLGKKVRVDQTDSIEGRTGLQCAHKLLSVASRVYEAHAAYRFSLLSMRMCMRAVKICLNTPVVMFWLITFIRQIYLQHSVRQPGLDTEQS